MSFLLLGAGYVALGVPSITFVGRKLGKRVCLQHLPVDLRQASTCFCA